MHQPGAIHLDRVTVTGRSFGQKIEEAPVYNPDVIRTPETALAGEGGKFSGSNLAPVLFCAVAGVLFLARHRSIDKRVIWFFLSFNVAALLSFVIFLLRFRWDPNLPVLAFIA